jgi:glycosyltransferase involved in cell wall biosynthesis
MARRSERLRDRVRVSGFVDAATLDLYHAATDVCLAPYHAIPISGSAALTWALSSGKPVIASRIPTFVEVAEIGQCLVLVAPGAADELAWQIGRLASDAGLRTTLVENARRFVADCSWPTVARLVTDVYGLACGGAVSGR